MIPVQIVWFLIALTIIGMAGQILMIGKPREPLTPVSALFTISFALLYLWAFATLAGKL
jgi:hypothetical protein